MLARASGTRVGASEPCLARPGSLDEIKNADVIWTNMQIADATVYISSKALTRMY